MDRLGDVVATWFLVAVFAACGAACVARALRLPAERAAWGPIGVGLLLYAGGSAVYNLELAASGGCRASAPISRRSPPPTR
jgi:hypothetical protein